MMVESNYIDIKIARKAFPAEAEDKEILQELGVRLAADKVTALLGRSGCGKTTLVRMIAGLDRDYAGRIEFCLAAQNGERERVGMVFQNSRLLPWKTVKANLEFAGQCTEDITTLKLKEALDLVRLTGIEQMYPRQLSGGMEQRVALARALIGDPDFLLLDEPFSSLDTITRNQIQAELAQIMAQKKLGALFVTHDVEEAIFMADTVILLGGSPSRVFDVITVGLEGKRDRLGESFIEKRVEVSRRLEAILRDEPTPYS